MTTLEQTLVALGRELDVPATPDLVARVAARLEPRRRRDRRPLVLALAAAVAVAIVAALAVPSARSTLLHFFHLGSATVERVQTLPPAEQRPLTSGLGPSLSVGEAARRARFEPILPAGVDRVYENEGAIVALLRDHRRTVLLTEFGRAEYFKKATSGATRIEQVRVGGAYGLWIAGGQHVVQMPSGAPRLAGNVLLWTHGDVTLRLEGKLTRAQALALARRIDQ